MVLYLVRLGNYRPYVLIVYCPRTTVACVYFQECPNNNPCIMTDLICADWCVLCARDYGGTWGCLRVCRIPPSPCLPSLMSRSCQTSRSPEGLVVIALNLSRRLVISFILRYISVHVSVCACVYVSFPLSGLMMSPYAILTYQLSVYRRLTFVINGWVRVVPARPCERSPFPT